MTWWFVYEWGKPTRQKPPPDDFKVTTPENSLLLQQAITNRGISVPYIDLQLNPYPNTQLDLFYSDNLTFLMHDSQYVTNQFDARIPICSLLTNLRKILVRCWLRSSSVHRHDEDHEAPWLQNPTVYKHNSF